jgi:hypothetical protein
VPVYALMSWFRRDALDRLGSGPFWNHALNWQTPSDVCTRRCFRNQCFLSARYVSSGIVFELVMPCCCAAGCGWPVYVGLLEAKHQGLTLMFT